MLVTYHNASSKIIEETIDADKVKYTSSLVKLYRNGILIDVFNSGDVVKIKER